MLVVKEEGAASSSSSACTSSTGVGEMEGRSGGGLGEGEEQSPLYRPGVGHRLLLLLLFVTGSRRGKVSKEEEKEK